MSPKDYMVFLMTRVEEAAAKGDREEVIRLCNVGKDTLDDLIRKANRV